MTKFMQSTSPNTCLLMALTIFKFWSSLLVKSMTCMTLVHLLKRRKLNSGDSNGWIHLQPPEEVSVLWKRGEGDIYFNLHCTLCVPSQLGEAEESHCRHWLSFMSNLQKMSNHPTKLPRTIRDIRYEFSHDECLLWTAIKYEVSY